MATRNRNIAAQKEIWYLIMTREIFSLLKEKPEISADDIAAKFRKAEVPPHYARTAIPLLVKSFQQQGAIKRLDKYIISTRSGKPLKVYASQQIGS